MTEIILGIIFAVCCLIGLSEVLHIIKQKIITPDNHPETRLVVFLDSEKADLQLAGIVNEYNWYKPVYKLKIIGIYSYIDDTAFENCRKIAEKQNITLCSITRAEQMNLLDLM